MGNTRLQHPTVAADGRKLPEYGVIIDTYGAHRSSRAARALSSKALDLPRSTINRKVHTCLRTCAINPSQLCYCNSAVRYLSLAPLQTLHTSRLLK